jgi:hypothetical protein
MIYCTITLQQKLHAIAISFSIVPSIDAKNFSTKERRTEEPSSVAPITAGKKEQQEKLFSDPEIDSIPATEEGLLTLYFSRPYYKNREEKEIENGSTQI